MMKRLLSLVLLSVVCLLNFASCSTKDMMMFDYTTLEFDKYLDFDRSLYTGQEITVPMPPSEVSDEDLDRYILDMRLSYSVEDQRYSEVLKEGTLKEGDLAEVWYRMTYLGKEVEGSCNYNEKTAPPLRLMEQENPLLAQILVGVKVEDTSLKKSTEPIKDGDVIYVSMHPQEENVQPKLPVGEMIRLELDSIDPLLKERFVGYSCGQEYSFCADWADNLVYNFEILFSVEEEEKAVKTTLKKDMYPEDSPLAYLNGKEVEMHVIVEEYRSLDVLDFDVSFIENYLQYPVTLAKMSQTNVNQLQRITTDYIAPDGVMVEMSREHIRREIANKRQATFEELQLERIWEKLQGNVKIKKYPKDVLSWYKEEVEKQFLRTFEEGKKQGEQRFPYKTEEEFAKVYFKTDLPYREYIEKASKETVGLLMMESYIAVKENLVPTEKQIDDGYFPYIDEIIRSNASYPSAPKTAEEVEEYFGIEPLRFEVRRRILSRQVLDFLIKNNTFVDEK